MPAFALALSLFVLSQSALLVKLAATSALNIGLWRMVFALPVLAALGAQRGSLGELPRLSARQAWMLLLCGLCLFAHWWTWFLSVQKTALANCMVIFAISPLFTAAGAWLFYKEPLRTRHAIAMILCFLGVYFVFRHSMRIEPDHVVGDLLGVAASILFSLYVLVGKGIRRGLSNVPFTIATYSSCAFFFLIVLAARGELTIQFPAPTWLAFFLLAMGPTILGHALFTYCLQHFNVNLMNILVLTEPIIGIGTAYLVLGEGITPGAAIGFFAISTGVSVLFVPALLQRARERKQA